MPNDPLIGGYRRAQEAELQKEFAIDEFIARTADVRQASMDVRDAGKLDRAEALDSEHRALHDELRALRLRG